MIKPDTAGARKTSFRRHERLSERSHHVILLMLICRWSEIIVPIAPPTSKQSEERGKKMNFRNPSKDSTNIVLPLWSW